MADEQQHATPLSAAEVEAIGQRLQAATSGYWMAGTLGGELRQNIASGSIHIARLDAVAGHEGVADLLYHAHDDLARLLATLDHERIQTDALLEHLQDEEAHSRAAYQAKLDAYRAIVAAVGDINLFAPGRSCSFCDKVIDNGDDNGHLPLCPVTQARALLAQEEQ